MIVENRAGAGGATGTRAVVNAPPDGYTLLVANTSVLAVGPAVAPVRAGYDPIAQLAAVAKFSESYQILVTLPSFPAKSVAEVIAYAKANPGKLNFSHSGPGGLPHLTGELFKVATGVDMVGVPFKSGGEAMTAVLGGQVQMTFEGITIVLPQIRDGKIRAHAITSNKRTPLAPEIPTMIEAGVPGYEVTTFNGIMAPVGTPPDIIKAINATINEGLARADVHETITKLGAAPSPGSPEDFAKFVAAQLAKWQAVAKAANIMLD